MITKNLLQRIKRLERQLKPQVDVMTPKQIQAMHRSDTARRNGSNFNQIVMILNSARKRMNQENQENELARQTAAAKAALEGSEVTEP